MVTDVLINGAINRSKFNLTFAQAKYPGTLAAPGTSVDFPAILYARFL